jgi:hypothetical protein
MWQFKKNNLQSKRIEALRHKKSTTSLKTEYPYKIIHPNILTYQGFLAIEN